jgi:hypothetical protein
MEQRNTKPPQKAALVPKDCRPIAFMSLVDCNDHATCIISKCSGLQGHLRTPPITMTYFVWSLFGIYIWRVFAPYTPYGLIPLFLCFSPVAGTIFLHIPLYCELLLNGYDDCDPTTSYDVDSVS